MTASDYLSTSFHYIVGKFNMTEETYNMLHRKYHDYLQMLDKYSKAIKLLYDKQFTEFEIMHATDDWEAIMNIYTLVRNISNNHNIDCDSSIKLLKSLWKKRLVDLDFK